MEVVEVLPSNWRIARQFEIMDYLPTDLPDWTYIQGNALETNPNFDPDRYMEEVFGEPQFIRYVEFVWLDYDGWDESASTIYPAGTPSEWGFFIIESEPSPVPGAVWLLGSGLIGLAALRKKFRG